MCYNGAKNKYSREETQMERETERKYDKYGQGEPMTAVICLMPNIILNKNSNRKNRA